LIKIYSPSVKGGKNLKKWLPMIKDFEDFLGRAGDAQSVLKKAKSLGAPPEVVAQLERSADKAEKILEEYLQKNGWHDDPPTGALKEFLGALKKIAWPSQAEDNKILTRHLAGMIHDIEKKSYDMNELENGIHSWRRALRKLLLDTQAMQGRLAFVPGREIDDTLTPFLQDAAFDHKYLNFAAPEGLKSQIKMNRELYQSLAVVVERLGKIKDNGETLEAIEAAYFSAAGAQGRALSKKEARSKAEALVGEKKDFSTQIKAAKELYAQVENAHLLEKIDRELTEAH
jgi:hypothetical protein